MVESIRFVSSRPGTLYVGTSYEVTCFVTMGNAGAVDTNVQARIQIAPLDRISIGDVSRVNDTTFSGNIIYSVLKSSDRAFPRVFASVSPTPMSRSLFIHQSPFVHESSDIRLRVQCKCTCFRSIGLIPQRTSSLQILLHRIFCVEPFS